MVDTYEYEEGTLNEIWENFQIKEDEVNDRLVIQRKDAAKTEIAQFASDGTLSAPVSVSSINNIEYIDEASDLPDASGGERQLEDNTAYYFTSFVADAASIRLGTVSPLLGAHGGISGYVKLGGGDAIVGTDKGVFMRNFYAYAPSGTIFNVSGDLTTEVLIESCAFSDAAGAAPGIPDEEIASLGTFDGFRVPSFKGCSFEGFEDGLTFTGQSDKIFFSECPLGRSITASGVTILEFDANCDTDIVDITDSYVKGVQSDTIVVDVDPGATIADIFQYRGTTHDNTVTEGNILTGAAGFDQVGYRADGSYPIEDSGVVGELSADGVISADTSTAGTDTYTVLDDGATSLGGESQRVSQPSPGVLQYDGKKDASLMINASMTVATGGNLVAAALSKNGTVQQTSEMRTLSSGGNAVSLSLSGVEQVETGDTIEVQVKNITDAADFTVVNYTLTFRD